MATRSYAYQNDYARELEAAAELRGELRGELKGELKADIRTLLEVLAARGLVPSSAERDLIGQCTDAALLRTWVVRAISAKSVAEVLADQ